jgi:ornithine carbamoyltransferase
MRLDRPEPWTIWTVRRARDASDLPRRATTVGREIMERTGMRDGLEVPTTCSGFRVFGFPASIMFEQAQSRLHTIKAILLATIGFG